MSFSSAPVQHLLNEKFICSGRNLVGDPSAGISRPHAPHDPPLQLARGTGAVNVQMLVFTPQGRIFHSIAGYTDPDELRNELEFALLIFSALQAEKDPARAKRLVQVLHWRRLEELGYSEAQIRSPAHLLNAKGNLALGLNVSSARDRVHADHRFAMDYALQSREEFRPDDLIHSPRQAFQGQAPRNEVGAPQNAP